MSCWITSLALDAHKQNEICLPCVRRNVCLKRPCSWIQRLSTSRNARIVCTRRYCIAVSIATHKVLVSSHLRKRHTWSISVEDGHTGTTYDEHIPSELRCRCNVVGDSEQNTMSNWLLDRSCRVRDGLRVIWEVPVAELARPRLEDTAGELTPPLSRGMLTASATR